MDQIEKEFPSISPKGRIDYTPDSYHEALEEAYAEKPYRELEVHAKELGLSEVAERMVQLAAETGKSANEPEVKQFDKEKGKRLIDEVLDKGSFEVYTNTAGGKIEDKLGHRASGHASLRSDRFFGSNPIRSAQEKVGANEFDERGVAEHLTVFSRQQEGRTLIFYEIAGGYTKFGNLYRKSDIANRPSNNFRCIFALETSLAEQLVGMAKENPEIIHSLVDQIMKEKILPDEKSTEVWQDKIKPPYKEWRDLEAGVLRMAFFNKENAASLSEAEIVEY